MTNKTKIAELRDEIDKSYIAPVGNLRALCHRILDQLEAAEASIGVLEGVIARKEFDAEAAEAEFAALRGAAVPFMYAIRQPDGAAWMDEGCVALDQNHLSAVLAELRRETGEDYHTVPVFTAPQPAPLVDAVPDGWQFKSTNGYWLSVTENGAKQAQKEGCEVRPLFTHPAPPVIDAGTVRDANRYRFLRDEDAWGDDTDSWDFETNTGLISFENLWQVRLCDFDDAIDARMADCDMELFEPAPPVVVLPSKVNVKMGGDKVTRSMLSGMNMMLKDCQKAIEAAGITVKSADGEG